MKNVLLIFWTTFLYVCLSATNLYMYGFQTIFIITRDVLSFLCTCSPTLIQDHGIWGKTVLLLAYFDWRKSCSRKSFLLRCPRSNYSHNFQCCMYKNVLMFTSFLNYIHTRLSGANQEQTRGVQNGDVRWYIHPMAKKVGWMPIKLLCFSFSMLIM